MISLYNEPTFIVESNRQLITLNWFYNGSKETGECKLFQEKCLQVVKIQLISINNKI